MPPLALIQIFQLTAHLIILPLFFLCCCSGKKKVTSQKDQSSVKRASGRSKSTKPMMPSVIPPMSGSGENKLLIGNGSQEGKNVHEVKKSAEGPHHRSVKSEKTQKTIQAEPSNKSDKLKKGQKAATGEEKGAAGAATGAAGDKKDGDKDKENAEAPPIVPMEMVQNKGLLDDFIEKTKAARVKEIEEMKTENSQQGKSKKTTPGGKVTFNEKKCELWETKNQETIDDDDGGGEEGA